jgi:hypothetical protein
MPTEYDVQELIEARKVVARALQKSVNRKQKLISFDVRRVDAPLEDIALRLNGRLESALFSTPGFVLEWHGHQIRGCDYAVSHSSYKEGSKAPQRVKGWHEHLWTDTDHDKYVVPVKPRIAQQDFMAVLHWCLRKWNIDASRVFPHERLGGRR